MLTRELPVPGHDLPEAASAAPEAASDLPETPSSRSGPWDAVVAPFTTPETQHDQSAPRYGGRTGVSRGEPPAEYLPSVEHGEHLPPTGRLPSGEQPSPGGHPPSGEYLSPVGPLPSGEHLPSGVQSPSGAQPSPGGHPPSGAGPRRTTMAFVAAGAAVVVAGVIALAFGRLGGASHPQAGCAGEFCPRETSSKAAAPRFRYRTVERDTGYFEGTVTLVNRGATPLRSWTLTFTYPGADVHNAWEVVLRQTGQNVAIVNAATAEPIAPGDEFEVRFGGSGRPGMPTNCRFNGTPCTFVR
jgi:hypothetical protein